MKAKLIFVCLILVYVVKFSEQKIQLGKLTYDSNKSLHSLVLNSVNNKVSHDLLAKFSYLSNELTVSKLNNSIEFHSRNKKIGVIKQVLSSNDLVKYTLKIDYSVGNLSETCFDYGHDEWYQTYEERIQKWPIDKKANVTTTPFNTMDFFSNPVGGLVESLWISSSGFAIYADKQLSQLYLRRNPNENGSLCLSASNQFELHLISGLNIMSTYKHAKNEYFKKPKSTSDQLMMQKPIWSTWAKYKANINQTTVLDFAKTINKNNFPNSQIEIDDKWEACYGTLKFDNEKFPNTTDMVSQLHKMGFRVTLWLHPFINNNCQVKDKEKYMVKDENNKVWPVGWWNGDGTIIDFTNEQAVNWFVSRIEQLKHETGIDSFKFDAGEFSWIITKLKKGFKFNNSSLNQIPSLYTKFYAEAVSRLGKMIEVRVGFDTQDLPIYVRMLDKLTDWSEKNGLRTLIPTALQMSLAGYPYILPDMIGGNAYGNYPTKELFIRWLQVNALMPSLQFSIAPWDFNDTQVVTISQKMVQLHLNFSSLITKLANEAVSTGDPIVRPIWWIAPEDSNTYPIGDEFLLGDDVLVAPVMYEKARKRDVYLPAGDWVDHRNEKHNGSQWIRNFKVELDELAYFQKQN